MERTILLLLLMSCVIVMTVECFDKLIPCTTGAACYPNRTVPEGLSASHPHYYCCLGRYRTLKLRKRKKTGTYKCWCRYTVKLERSVRSWAESSKDGGRMCLREEQCRLENRNPSVTVVVKRRFLYCCYGSGINKENATYSLARYMTFDEDKEEFIVCRCAHQPLPTPAAPEGSVAVLPVPGYRSSGEACSYDVGCEDMPLLKCHQPEVPHNVTFCCYGSRGMVTQNDADGVTRCTCTQNVYGAQCDVRPPTTLALSPTQHSTTLSASTWAYTELRQNTSQMSTTTARATIQEDASQIITTIEDPSTRTGEDTSQIAPTTAVTRTPIEIDASQMTTTAHTRTPIGEDASQITTTTANTTTTPIACLTNCKDRAEEDVCIDSHQTRMCCPHNMAVMANQSAGRFTSCTCLAHSLKWCGRETSIATRFSSRLGEVISLVFAVCLLGQSGWFIVV